ncbi:MAG: EamA family transporter [Bacteroidales bacterium]
MSAQIFLKIAFAKMGAFAFKWHYFKVLFASWQLAVSGISITSASILWIYILKKYPFSIAYPLISLSYIFGMLAAMLVFNEEIPMSRWIGVVLIMSGVYFIIK